MSTAVTVLAGIGAVLAAVFVAVYATRPWWRTMTGRILMVTVAVLAVLFALRVADRLFGMVPDWAFLVAYLSLDLGLAGLLWDLLRGKPVRDAHRQND